MARTPRGRHAAAPSPAVASWGLLAGLVLPVACAGCAEPDRPLCGSCRDRLPRSGWPVPVLATSAAPRTWAGGDYEGVLQRVVLAFKDDGRHDLSAVLAGSLTRCADAALRQSGWSPARAGIVLVPAPSSTRAVRRRGADLTAGLAVAAAAGLRRRGWRATTVRALRQSRGMQDQAGLSIASRARNVSGALIVRRPSLVRGRSVLLVDDVVTTGATLAAAATAVERAGGVVLAAATLAATRLRGGSAPALTGTPTEGGRHRLPPGLSVSHEVD